jgi:hypothetical protein
MEQLNRFLEKRPALKVHYEHEGSFRQYVEHFVAGVPKNQPGRLARLICNNAARTSGVDNDALLDQLKEFPLVSTADHAGIMQYPILFNSNLLLSGMMKQFGQPYHVVLASGRIPLGNASYPRGFIFSSKKFNFFGDTKTKIPVSLLDEGLNISENFRLLGLLTNGKAYSECSYNQKKYLDCIFLNELFRDTRKLFGLPFVEQLPYINEQLWNLFFSKETRSGIPKLVYLNIEEIVRQLVVADLADENSLLYRLLFEQGVRRIYLHEFSNLYGCWSNYSGTHFFWGVGPKLTLHPLRLNHSQTHLVALHSSGQDRSIPLQPDAIIEAVLSRRIIPSIFTEMFLLAFVEGYTLLGGFNQVDYLAWMRVQHERCLLRLGEWPLAARFARTPTDGLICGLMPFPQWESSLDMIWAHNSTDGRFHGNLDGGLTRADLDKMMDTSMKELIENGVGAMLNVIE